ncbi:MAG: hypothetical protein CVT90_02315, partial [Candidatus Altiarchaeales archaeon HGW-Altiarchaeales-3]
MKISNLLPGTFKVCIILFLLMNFAVAIPHQINFEGKLADSGGTALEGDYAMTFKIYDAQTGGTALWTETYSAVNVKNGVFNVLLGSQTALNLNFDLPYYLEVKIGTETLSPRQPLASVGYAYRAEYCDMGDSDWNISGNDMYSGVLGNVGIGTANPTSKLDVLGDAQIGSYMNLGEDVYGSWGSVLVNDKDTCNEDITNQYDCLVDVQKNCIDIRSSNQKRTVNCTINRFGLVIDTTKNSIALGAPKEASGLYSTAMGQSTTANGYVSTAMGSSTTASGSYSTAMGSHTAASGLFSTAMGHYTTSSGQSSTAIGQSTTASGMASTAMGVGTTA